MGGQTAIFTAYCAVNSKTCSKNEEKLFFKTLIGNFKTPKKNKKMYEKQVGQSVHFSLILT